MLRVIIREINSADGHLLGDFPPSEIPALVELVGRTGLYIGDEDCRLVRDLSPTQIVGDIGPTGPDRAIFEILVESSEG